MNAFRTLRPVLVDATPCEHSKQLPSKPASAACRKATGCKGRDRAHANEESWQDSVQAAGRSDIENLAVRTVTYPAIVTFYESSNTSAWPRCFCLATHRDASPPGCFMSGETFANQITRKGGSR
jgi:hypothetical protein